MAAVLIKLRRNRARTECWQRRTVKRAQSLALHDKRLQGYYVFVSSVYTVDKLNVAINAASSWQLRQKINSRLDYL